MSIVKLNYEIKRAELKDSYSIVILVQSLLSELHKKDVDLNLECSVEVCSRIIANDDNRIFIALDKEKVIGVITVVQSMAIYAGGRFGIINEFYVLPEYRSCGVGNLLIEETIKLGKSKEWHRIEVGAPNENNWQRTIDFYIRENFTPIGPRLKKDISC
jgi:GNAT superfamily N-acetyltransferase